jgi:hypothetical protein
VSGVIVERRRGNRERDGVRAGGGIGVKDGLPQELAPESLVLRTGKVAACAAGKSGVRLIHGYRIALIKFSFDFGGT